MITVVVATLVHVFLFAEISEQRKIFWCMAISSMRRRLCGLS